MSKNSYDWRQIRKNNEHWFAPGAMRFFNSVVYWDSLVEGEDCWYFVSSEQFDDQTPRKFTVRKVNADIRIGTDPFDFQAFDDLDSAEEAIQQLIKKERENN